MTRPFACGPADEHAGPVAKLETDDATHETHQQHDLRRAQPGPIEQAPEGPACPEIEGPVTANGQPARSPRQLPVVSRPRRPWCVQGTAV